MYKYKLDMGYINMSMTVKINDFEGPLDLLLHLIEKNKMSIYDIQIAPITDQYMEYIKELENSKGISLESMSDFILMASTLLLIKSRMLLPKPEIEDPEDDPRGELVARLLEYKKMKHISEKLKKHEKDAEKVYYRNVATQLDDYTEPAVPVDKVLANVSIEHICGVFAEIMNRNKLLDSESHDIDDLILRQDTYTVKEKSNYLLDLLEINESIVFHEIFTKHTSKMEMIVTFMALLELVHKKQVRIYQERLLDDIWISGVDGDGTIES